MSKEVSSDAVDAEEFQKLLDQVMSDPDSITAEDSNIPDDKLYALYKHLSQYSRMACEEPTGPVKNVSYVSISNVRESYMRRFIMTGMVGYIYQMLKEHRIEENERSWFPSAPKELDPYNLEDLVKRTAQVHEYAVQALKSQKDYENISANNLRALELREKAELTDDEKAELEKFGTKEKMDEDEKYHIMSSEFCRYKATYLLTLFGREAQEKIVKTRKQACSYKEVKERCEEEKLRYVEPPGKLTMPAEKASDIIRSFLDTWFKFDPSVHVRSGASNKNEVDVSKIEKSDETGVTLEFINNSRLRPKAGDAILSDINYLTSDKDVYNAALAVARDPKLSDIAVRIAANPENYEKYLVPQTNRMMLGGKVQKEDLPTAVVPPQDTFHRWSYYMEVNHSCLRTITEAIYPEKLSVDQMIAIWGGNVGTDDENRKAFDAHNKRYASQMPDSIYMVPHGKWVVMTNHEKNRDNIKIYNQNTMVLERILERYEEDKKIGAELMKNRIRTAKAKNVREDGPDAANLSSYKSSNKSMTSGKPMSSEDMLRMRADNGDKVARDEIRQIDQLREIVNSADAKLLAGQELAGDENERYRSAKNELANLIDLLDVPANAVRIDVFENKDDTMTRKTIYTAADK